ncbi:MAG: hypothetical protein IPL67_14350 [Ignavibacteria bacterium]|nr:hypothetical protein [Ignavibacteria bacterium]
MLLSKGRNPATILLHVFIIIFLIVFSSCKPGRKLESGEARIKGRIVNPTRNFIEFKKTTDPAAKNDTIKLNDGGEFEIIAIPDTLAAYSFVYGAETKSDTLSSDVNSMNLIVSNKTQELSILLDKEFDIKLWVDTRDPSASLSISGNGADLNNYVTRKLMLKSEFKLKNGNLLKSGPEEYSRFMKEYKAGLDKLLSGLPSKSPYIPEGFRELEAKNIYLTFNTLKLKYAIEHLPEEGEASQFTPDETYFAFLKEIPFDNPEELKNLNYELPCINLRRLSVKKKTLERLLHKISGSVQSMRLTKKIFADPATRDRVLFEFLKKKTSGSLKWSGTKMQWKNSGTMLRQILSKLN